MRSYSYQNPDDRFEVFFVKTFDCLYRGYRGAAKLLADALCAAGKLGSHIKDHFGKEE